MTTLREAAQAALTWLDRKNVIYATINGAPDSVTQGLANRLRAALATPEPAIPVGVWSKEPPKEPYEWIWYRYTSEDSPQPVRARLVGGEYFSIPITPPEVK